jgi:hypothetical protein
MLNNGGFALIYFYGNYETVSKLPVSSEDNLLDGHT